MSLRFPYKLLPTKKPVTSLDGRLVRPRPLIVVTVIGPTESTTQTAHLDPGSDDCVFPDYLAAKIGVDLDTAPIGEASGVGQEAVPLRYARVTLRVASGDELLEWPAWVAFAALPLKRPLLGFAGFLQFFTATFHGDTEEAELTVNTLFPGGSF